MGLDLPVAFCKSKKYAKTVLKRMQFMDLKGTFFIEEISYGA